MQLLFKKPASDFFEAIPVGNGRLGAMIYGELMREQVVLNENSMWSGNPEETDRMEAKEQLPNIRKLLAEGRNFEAEKLFAQYFTCRGKGSFYAHGSTVPFGCYQILGRLHLSYFQALSQGRQDSTGVKDYRRFLDLDQGIVKVEFCLGGKLYEREWIASKGQEALCLHLKGEGPGLIHVGVGLDRDEKYAIEPLDGQRLLMRGQLADGYGTDKGVSYACVVGVKTKGGRVYAEGNRLFVEDADEAMLVVTAETDLQGFMGRNPKDCERTAILENERALEKSWEEVKEEHLDWYQSQFKTMELWLSGDEELEKLPTPRRLALFLEGKEDPGLSALYVQYARYLLISSSQPGGIAANLQGIWADEIQTPWNGDYHLNAQQMIYWLAEKAGLSQSHLPYLELTRDLAEPGRKTAKAYYGARGWLVHTCTNVWGFTSPLEDAAWGSTTGSPAWLCHHLWEHYLYTENREELKRYYPVMKEAAQFYLDMLVEDSNSGWLVTSPSSSPENSFYDEEGRKCSLCQGPAYDRELILSLVQNCLDAQKVLGDDEDFQEELLRVLPKLAPVEIGKDGRIMEWGEEYPEAMPFHRHLAHLWGLYPGNLISRYRTPELSKAARKSLENRGRTTVGWAIAYRMSLWARLGEGEEAYGYVKDMFRYATAPNLFNLAYHCDETTLNPELPDLEQCRYPFQIDGNQGNAQGILLMLFDEEAEVDEKGEISVKLHLLPALPKAFGTGSLKGVCAKGRIVADLSWEKGELESFVLRGPGGKKVTIEYKGREWEAVLGNGCYTWRKE